MNAVFGDPRRRTRNRIVPRCGSCSRRVPTVTLPVSGLRRCDACVEVIRSAAEIARWDGQGFCDWPRLSGALAAARVAPQPELEGLRHAPTSQPTIYRPGVYSSSPDTKRRAAGDEVA